MLGFAALATARTRHSGRRDIAAGVRSICEEKKEKKTAMTELLEAVKARDEAQALKLVASSSPEQLNFSQKGDGWTPLHWAVALRQDTVARALLSAGAVPEAKTSGLVSASVFASVCLPLNLALCNPHPPPLIPYLTRPLRCSSLRFWRTGSG
eukprot:m.212526 g.212526  ORF g.212526 m.212526 type:complete len:153 (-) comp22152_c0_seq6:148-606(-)